MFGFFKRRDRSAEPVAPGTWVEEVPFTARELFAIMGDVDAPVFICNTTTLPLLRPGLMRPDEWRRRAAERLAPAGIVDGACNPCPELERLLEPLRTRGVEISDGTTPGARSSRDPRSFCLCANRERATLVRASGDGPRRTFTLSDAGPSGTWWTQALRAAGFPRVRCAPPAASVPFIEGDPADEGFAEALMRGESDRVRAFARRWGADPDRLAETSSLIASSREVRTSVSYLRVIDAIDAEVNLIDGGNFTMHQLVGGDIYVSDATLFPPVGFALIGHRGRREGMPSNWYDDDALFRAAAFCSLDWLADGDLVAHLMSDPPFPEHLAEPWRPGGE